VRVLSSAEVEHNDTASSASKGSAAVCLGDGSGGDGELTAELLSPPSVKARRALPGATCRSCSPGAIKPCSRIRKSTILCSSSAARLRVFGSFSACAIGISRLPNHASVRPDQTWPPSTSMYPDAASATTRS